MCVLRFFREYASRIASDEQNLDIPKQLKSSEQCAVPGVSWQSKHSRLSCAFDLFRDAERGEQEEKVDEDNVDAIVQRVRVRKDAAYYRAYRAKLKQRALASGSLQDLQKWKARSGAKPSSAVRKKSRLKHPDQRFIRCRAVELRKDEPKGNP